MVLCYQTQTSVFEILTSKFDRIKIYLPGEIKLPEIFTIIHMAKEVNVSRGTNAVNDGGLK